MIIKYYTGRGIIGMKLKEEEIDPDKKAKKAFTVTVWSGDLNDRIGNELKELDHKYFHFDTFREAANKFKELFDEYDAKSHDFKGHSMGALKFYWEHDGKEILTYVKLHYGMKEISEFDAEAVNFK